MNGIIRAPDAGLHARYNIVKLFDVKVNCDKKLIYIKQCNADQFCRGERRSLRIVVACPFLTDNIFTKTLSFLFVL
jgi:hypothetical protein